MTAFPASGNPACESFTVRVEPHTSPVAHVLIAKAHQVNEELYGMVSAHPDRFSALATLPLGVPEAAAAELGRAVKELGFVGTMICGTIASMSFFRSSGESCANESTSREIPMRRPLRGFIRKSSSPASTRRC